MKTSVLLLLASLLSVFIRSSGLDDHIIDLYSKDSPVVHMNSSNFNSLLHGKPHFWAVEFYSSWCGHCKLYAPEWEDIADQSASKCWKESGLAMRSLCWLLTQYPLFISVNCIMLF